MVFIKTLSEPFRYVSISGSGSLCVTTEPATCFFSDAFHKEFRAPAPIYTVLQAKAYIAPDNTFTPDPAAASKVYVVWGPGDFFVLFYTEVSRYWKICGEEVQLTDDPTEATVFVRENFVFQGVDIDKCYEELLVHGVTILPGIVSSEVVDKMISKLDLPSENGEQIRRGDLLARDPIFGEALLHPIVRMILHVYLHPRSKIATWSSNTLYHETSLHEKPNQTESFLWHVDYPYHDMQAPWQVAPMSAQVLWCLDEFRVDNGGTNFIRGAHMAQTFPTPKTIVGHPVQTLTAPKGSIVITHGGWWHKQGVNTTSTMRTCLLGTYVQPWIRAKDDMVGQVNALPDDHPVKTALQDII
jgi:hypothetical protein